MTAIKINEQIAFLRKQKGLTQEELAKTLGVTNQAVSKWESAQCCPDIQLLPGLAKIFDVSIDELIGYKSTEELGDICLKIKEHFSSLPEKKTFESAYRIVALLHEIVSTDGYKKTVPWEKKITPLIIFHLGVYLSVLNLRVAQEERITASSFLWARDISLRMVHKCVI